MGDNYRRKGPRHQKAKNGLEHAKDLGEFVTKKEWKCHKGGGGEISC